MPTYINESNYMQMNRAPHPNQWSHSNRTQLDHGLIDRYGHQQAHDLDCKQILRHIQDCPVCQHVFVLKTPPTKIVPSFIPTEGQYGAALYQTTSTNKIEISISTLILISVFLVIFFIYIIKTSRN